MNPGYPVHPQVGAIHEYRGERQSESVSSFGEPDSLWATRIGITVADANTRGRGRGYWEGAGHWKMPRFGRHGLPVDLVVELDVVSPRWASERPAEGDRRREIVLPAWNLARVREYVTATIEGIGTVDADELEPRLGEFFDVETLG